MIDYLLPGFEALLALLHQRQAEYLLVGGFAVRYYGYPRATTDLDLWTGRHPANVAKIMAALRDFLGCPPPEQAAEALEHERRIVRISSSPPRLEILDPLPGRRPEVLLSFEIPPKNLTGLQDLPGSRDRNPGEQVEFLTLQSGVQFEACFAERVAANIDGIEVNVISLRHLKILKQAGGRPQDLDDLAHLP